ncbi:hypothetical protein KJ940_05520, partial [Myxococcota bacterium]|nr:hypothetical protein [Myxococcota bacterium]
MRAHALLYLAGLSATLLWGCFSGDDFSDCQEDRQCGPARFCKQGECVFKDSITVYDSGLPPAPDAARPTPDAALEVVILGESTLSGTTNKGEVHLRLDQEATVAPLSREGGGGGFVELQAAIVEITGRINGQGAGEPGGGGGGGGGGRVNSSAEDSIGGVGGIGPTSRDEAEAGHAGTAAAAGQGGQGRDGGGVCGGAGGLPGALDAPEGAAGEAGRRVEALACVSPTTFYYGCGGGGGGGAAGLGDPGGQDRNGFGGGGGGAGGVAARSSS